MIKSDRLFSDKQCQRVCLAWRLYTSDLLTDALRIFNKDYLDLRSFLGPLGETTPTTLGSRHRSRL